jgi:OOP family OmpA-OmpF porin
MKPSTRWTIVIIVAIALGIIWLLWPKTIQEPTPVKAPVAPPPTVAQPPAPKPEPIPPAAAPQAEEPVTATVLFDFDKSAVRAGEAPKLDELAGKVKARAFERLDVVGHADRIGTNVYNMGLSKRRAEAVQAYLAGKGIEAGRTRAEAKGEDEAVTGDACKSMGPENRKNQKLIACLQPDRRVEVRLVSPR